MLELEIRENIAEKTAVFERLRDTYLFEARRSGMVEAGVFLSTAIRQWIESGGKGTWEKPHPLSTMLTKSGNKWAKRGGGYVSPYYSLGKYARYVANNNFTFEQIGFGNFKAGDSKKGRQLSFSKQLQDIALAAQTSRSIPVTPKMRLKFGATRGVIGEEVGSAFFPLRKSTTMLNIPARPIMRPVFATSSVAAYSAFEKRFNRSIFKRFEKG